MNEPFALSRRCAAELVGTFFLVFAGTGATGAKEKGLMAGIAVGGTVALCAAMGGPVSGAPMNPARSIGPALPSGEPAGLWIDLLAPVLGAAQAIGTCRCVREPGRCAHATSRSA